MVHQRQGQPQDSLRLDPWRPAEGVLTREKVDRSQPEATVLAKKFLSLQWQNRFYLGQHFYRRDHGAGSCSNIAFAKQETCADLQLKSIHRGSTDIQKSDDAPEELSLLFAVTEATRESSLWMKQQSALPTNTVPDRGAQQLSSFS